MNIFIAGGGRVGFHLARLLCIENHDVTIVEVNAARVKQLDYALDVRTMVGDAASVLALQQAGISEAELFVALTGDDEVNLIAAATAKGLGAAQVVARVDNPMYIESNMLYETALGIDYLLSPDALTALDIMKYVQDPGIVVMENFARGMVQLQQMRVTRSPTVGGKTLKDITLPPGVLIGVISRKGATLIPHGNSTIEAGDLVTFIGRKEQMQVVKTQFHGTEPDLRKVVIMGGGRIGLHLAQIMEAQQFSIKLIEWDLAVCQDLAGKLKSTKVVCRDATARLTLEEEHVDGADVFVSTAHDDEHNIMAGVLAKEVGVSHTIAVVHQPDFAPLVAKLGIDHAVTPRASFANRVLKLVHQKSVSSLAVLEEGQIEIMEVGITADTPIIGKTLADVFNSKRGTTGVLVASILRGEQVIVPRGDDEFHAGDSIILIATPDALDSALRLLKKR